MLRTKFEEELDKLHNQFYSMGTEVLAQLNKTVRAFVSHDRDLAKEVIEEDDLINEFETKLEKKIIRNHRLATTCFKRFTNRDNCFKSIQRY